MLRFALALVLCLSFAPTPPAGATPRDRLEALDAELKEHMAKARMHPALATATRLHDLQKRRFGAGDPRTLTTLRLVLTYALGTGNYVRAVRAGEELVATVESQSGPESADLAWALDSLAGVHFSLQDFRRAQALYRRSLAIKRKVHGEKSVVYATGLQVKGSFLMARHSYAEAERFLEQAQSILHQLYGADDPRAMNPSMNLAFVYAQRGERTKAIRLLERLTRSYEKGYGGDPSTLSTFLLSIATLYEQWGDQKRADAIYARIEQALRDAVAEQRKKGDRSRLRHALQSMATLHQRRGEVDRAVAAYREILAIDEKLHGPDSAAVTAALFPLAELHRSRGDYPTAIAILERTRRLFAKQYSGWHSVTPTNLLAEIYREQGDFAAARREIERVVRAATATMGASHPVTAQMRERLGVILLAAGNQTAAIRALEQSLAVADRHMGVVLAAGTEADNRVYLAQRAYQLDLALTAHVRYAPRDRRAARMALRAILARKGRVLDAVAGSMGVLRSRMSDRDRKLLDELTAARAQLANLVVSGPGATGEETYRTEVARLEKLVAGLEATARARSAEFRAHDQPVDLARVQRAIPKGAVLVEFAAYRVFDPSAQGGAPLSGERRYVAYVVGPRGDPRWVDLGAAAELERRVEALRKALARPRRGYESAARSLHDALFAPIEPALGGQDRVILAPDGALNLVPFAALLDRNGRHLVRRYSFSYLTSGRDLLRLGVAVAPKEAPMVIADPDFDRASGPADGEAGADAKEEGSRQTGTTPGDGRRSRDLRDKKWSRLPGTAQEAQAIRKELAGARVLQGARATERALKSVRGPRILHVATHGFFLPPDDRDEPEEASLAAPAPQGPPRMVAPIPPPTATAENPLLRSGLTLAGANSPRGGGEDGILTALEAAGLDLWGTRLVVLSACETGVGEVTEGDGVHGLRRAFVIAGAETLLMSLWQVDDLATRDLMTGYYRRLRNGAGRAEALRQVQLSMLEDDRYTHPFYWASFIPAGAWTPITMQESP